MGLVLQIMTEIPHKLLDRYQYPWHKSDFPEIDTIVIGKAFRIDAQNGIFFHLLDYMSREAYMPLRQISVKKVKRVRSFFKEGDVKPILVSKVDLEKGHIDVSNKYLEMAKDDIERLQKYEKLIKIFYSWLLSISNRDKEIFTENIDMELWKRIMGLTLWNFSISDIYDNMIQIRSDKKTIRDVFPLLHQALESRSIDSIDLTDMISLNKIIFSHINFEITVVVRLRLLTWKAYSLSFIQKMIALLGDKISLYHLPYKLMINAPHYEFVIKNNNKDKMEKFYENVDIDFMHLLEQSTDIDFSIEKKMS